MDFIEKSMHVINSITTRNLIETFECRCSVIVVPFSSRDLLSVWSGFEPGYCPQHMWVGFTFTSFRLWPRDYWELHMLLTQQYGVIWCTVCYAFFL